MTSSKTSTIIAITALVVAVFAATPLGQAAGRLVLPKNSVGAAQIKKSAVTGLKVKNGTLMAADFKAGQLPRGSQGPKGDTGPRGPLGPQGPKGDPGARGPKGDPGATKVTRRYGTPGADATPGTYSTASASCQAGETMVAGGGAGYNTWAGGKPTLTASFPDDGGHWSAVVRNDGVNGTVKAYAYALCASP